MTCITEGNKYWAIKPDTGKLEKFVVEKCLANEKDHSSDFRDAVFRNHKATGYFNNEQPSSKDEGFDMA